MIPVDNRNLSGPKPPDSKPVDPTRSDLFNRLHHFFMQFDPESVPTAEKLVDWSLRNGEEALNEKLLAKYGKNLETLGKSEAGEREGSLQESKRRTYCCCINVID